MYKVMLVDDDVPMIKYLSKLIDWGLLQIEIVAVAHSGKRALQLFRETSPDIVITDIGMPLMDGMELAAEMQKLKPEVRILFLTCHQEFHYARKAVQLDADDYLIKDEITAEQLEESLRKSVQDLKTVRQQLEEISYKREIFMNKDVLKRQFLKQLTLEDRHDDLLTSGKQLGIEWKHSHFMIAMGNLNYASFPKRYRYKDEPILLYAISNIAEEMLDGSLEITTLTDQESYFLCILNYQPNLSCNIVERFSSFLASLREKIHSFLRIGIHVYYSSPFKGISNISQELRSLKQDNREAFYSEISFGVLPSSELKLWNHEIMVTLEALWSRLVQGFKDSDDNAITIALEEIKEKAKHQQLDPVELMGKCSQWIRVMEFERDLKGEDSFHRCLQQCGRWDAAVELMKSRIQEIMISGTSSSEKNMKLKQIDRYISEHLSENITLVDMADTLFLNPSYFSRSFKLETGMNFTDYVHRYKMNIACKLLKESMESTEIIAFKLGYMERTYFSKVFKKYVGVSPKDYR
ncbi:response regulator transcription factor [Paenibacillus foliorum]|nr:response regulator [Paenibacillus foliorum]